MGPKTGAQKYPLQACLDSGNFCRGGKKRDPCHKLGSRLGDMARHLRRHIHPLL
jgi:hypothetical protein